MVRMISKYKKPIRVVERMSQKEEQDLLLRAKNGDTDANNKLWAAHQYLVRAAAVKYIRGHADIEDLMQEGCLGFLHAIKKYDPEKATGRFATYMLYWVRNSMFQYLNRYALSAGPRSQNRDVRLLRHSYNRKLTQLMAQLKREPTHEEQAEFMNVAVESLHQFLAEKTTDLGVATDSKITEEGPTFVPVSNMLSPDVYMEKKQQINQFNNLLSGLNDRERSIIEARYLSGEEVTFRGLAPRFGISHERVRQLEAQALGKMRDAAGVA